MVFTGRHVQYDVAEGEGEQQLNDECRQQGWAVQGHRRRGGGMRRIDDRAHQERRNEPGTDLASQYATASRTPIRWRISAARVTAGL